MRPLIQIQKLIENNNFFDSTVYERYDLRGVISLNQKFVTRQGDLLITNYYITRYNERGLVKAYLKNIGKYFVFRESHIIIPANENTVIFHNEHGLLVIPAKFETLNFYTFRNAYD